MNNSQITKNIKFKYFLSENAERFQERTQCFEILYPVASSVYYDLRITVAECTGQYDPSHIFSKIPESNCFEIEKLLDSVLHPLRIIVSGKVP